MITMALVVAGVYYALGGTISQLGGMARFIATMRYVETHFAGDVTNEGLISGAIDGMMKGLGDKHSVYMNPEKYKQLKNMNEGSFGGIGVVMSFSEPGHCRIMSVMDNAPGKEAGLQPGDEVVAVDGTSIEGMQPEEIVGHIRGDEGTTVMVTIRRQGNADKDYSIVRANIPLTTADGNMIPDTNIAYIRVASFSENTAKEFKAALDKQKEAGAKGLIIDLRANPGGLVTSCVDIANMVLPAGDVVSMIDRNGRKEVFKSTLAEQPMPIVILIDKNSASASEILAGAMQDRKAAVIVGTKSFGKGSVQTVLPLFYGDAIKLTIAKYYTPSGRSIDGVGVEPDVLVELPEHPTRDTQLDKAIEVIKEKLQ